MQSSPSSEWWSDDASASDTDNFVKTLSRIRGKGVMRPDLLGSVITHYASKCLGEGEATWRKKRCFIETLVGILPPEKDSVPCSFLLRLMRAADMAGIEGGCRQEIDKRVARQLDQASPKELAVLDAEALLRLLKSFLDEEEVSRSGAALNKVARLVDAYLAQAAVNPQLPLPQFVALASALPCHARATDDGIYRAIDIYLKAHPGLSKQERKRLCMLIESRKLSREACLHAAQNERLPVRAVIQVLLSEQDKLSRHIDWSGPGMMMMGPEMTARCLSKREVRQQMEMKRLKEDVVILQMQCLSMERQIEKLLEKKRNGYFSWKKLVFKPTYKIGETAIATAEVATPMHIKRGPTSYKSLQLQT